MIWCFAFLGTGTVMQSNRLALDYLWYPLLSLLILAFLLVPFALAIWASKERLQCLALVTLLTLFWIALSVVPLRFIGSSSYSEGVTVGFAIFFSFTLVTVGVTAVDMLAPVKSINQRLLFLGLGTLSLVALNMISVVGLHRLLEAPKPPL